MAWLVRTLRLPAAESHTNLALVLCVFLMGLLSVALIWQAQIIAKQMNVERRTTLFISGANYNSVVVMNNS